MTCKWKSGVIPHVSYVYLLDTTLISIAQLVATHAISKSQQNFQNRIPRELDKNFYIPRISMIHWISSNLLKLKNRQQKKVISNPNPGIQPRNVWKWWKIPNSMQSERLLGNHKRPSSWSRSFRRFEIWTCPSERVSERDLSYTV